MVDVGHIDAVELVFIGRVIRIFRADAAAIDKNQSLVIVHAAQADVIAHGTLRDVEIRGRLQGLCQGIGARAFEVLLRDDLDGRRRLANFLLRARSRNDDIPCLDGACVRAVCRGSPAHISRTDKRAEHGSGQQGFLFHGNIFLHLTFSISIFCKGPYYAVQSSRTSLLK